MLKRLVVLVIVAISSGLIVVAAPLHTLAQDGKRYYIVREGDTLSSIADRYHVTIYAIIAANHLDDGNALYIGQRLVIPNPPSASGTNNSGTSTPADPPGKYTVREGDSLIRIADRFGVSIDQLMAANKISDASLVQVGRVLTIPTGVSDQTVSTTPPLPDGQQTVTVPYGPSISFEIAGGKLASLLILTTSAGKQGFPLSCEAKVAEQIATMYNLAFNESGFLAKLPHSLNPRRGFVGAVDGRFYWPGDVVGGNAYGPGGYGVHVEGWAPTFQAMSGFSISYLASNRATARAQIDNALRHGYPVAVWAVLGFRPSIEKNSLWIGATANGTAIDCGGAAPGCSYLVSGEHAYLILGRNGDSYQVYNPGSGEMEEVARNTLILGIINWFAIPTGSAPGAVIIPTGGHVPDLSRLPAWQD